MFTNLPPVTKALLIANGLVFLLELVLGDAGAAPFMLWPLQAGGFDALSSGTSFMPWQLLTYGFLHDPASFAHLLFNMLALLMFGAPLEYTWGNRRFLTYYLVCVAGAGLCQLAVTSWMAAQGAAGRPDARRIGRRVRPAAGLRHAVPEPAGDAADPADPDEGAHAGDHLRRDRTAARLHRPAAGRRPLRPPGRHAVRLAADQLLARQAALQPQRLAACGAF